MIVRLNMRCSFSVKLLETDVDSWPFAFNFACCLPHWELERVYMSAEFVSPWSVGDPRHKALYL